MQGGAENLCEPAEAVARKRSVPEGFLDGERRAGKESRRVAELKDPHAGSGERTIFPRPEPDTMAAAEQAALFRSERGESAKRSKARARRRRCGAQAGSTEGSLPLKRSAPINLTGSGRQELAAQPAERQMAADVDGQVYRRAAGSSRRSNRPGTEADAGHLSVPREGGQGSGSAGTG